MAVAALVLGYQAVTFSLSQRLANRDPSAARRLAPYDGRVTARLALLLAGPEASAQDRRQSDLLAKAALRQDATTVLAVATAGLNAQVRGDVRAARGYMTYARTLSRRNAQVQIWSIEDAVARGDVSGALRQYDVALRVNPTLSEILFPILAEAIADANVRPALIRTLAGKPAWGESFVNFVPANTSNPKAAADFLLGLRRAGVPVMQAARAGLVDALLAKGFVDDAWRFYTSYSGASDRRGSRDPGFAAAAEPPSRFDWTPVSDGTISSSIQRTGQTGVFDFAAPTGAGGPLLRQVQVLPAGRYRLTARSTGIDQQPTALPYWVLTCPDGRELGRVSMASSAGAASDVSGIFDVPASCPMQTLVLVARPSDAQGGLAGQIVRAALVHVP